MWSRRRSESELERGLRGLRAEASDDFVDGLSQRLVWDRRPAGRAWSRLAFASAVSVFILGTFASFGGLSYAASGATGTYDAVQQVVVKHKLTVSVHTSSAAGQYPHSPTEKPAAVHVKKTPHGAVLGVQAVSGDTLPFTGISLLGTFVVSLALIGTGIALRRRERKN
jgi:hypothetical protein